MSVSEVIDKTIKSEDERLFYVHRWGETGLADLWAFVPFSNQKSVYDLQLHESTEGKFQNPTSDKKPERITRVR